MEHSPETSDAHSSGDEFKKGLWTAEEDEILMRCVQTFKEGNWSTISQKSGLNRSGKSCRLRWVKHLSPAVKTGPLTEEEQKKVIQLQARKRASRRHNKSSMPRSHSATHMQGQALQPTHIGQLALRSHSGLPSSKSLTAVDDSDDLPWMEGEDTGSSFDRLVSSPSLPGIKPQAPVRSSVAKCRVEEFDRSSAWESEETRRERHMAEAQKIWDRILASPTGMCAALRETMPSVLLATSGFVPVEPPANQEAHNSPQSTGVERKNERNGVMAAEDGSSTLRSNKVGSEHLSGLAGRCTEASSNVVKPCRPCTNLRPIDVKIEKTFGLPEMSLTPPESVLGRSLVSPGLAALIMSPHMDWTWDGSKMTLSPGVTHHHYLQDN